MKVFSQFLLLTASTAAILLGASPKVSPDVQNAGANSTVPVIVQYDHPPSAADNQKTTLLGGLIHNAIGLVNALILDLPVQAIASLAQDPSVT